MLFRPKKNRRRVDLAKKTGELKASAKRVAPTVLRVVASALVTAAVAFGGYTAWGWATTSDTFAISSIAISGNQRATEIALLKLGNVQIGTNIILAEVSAMERSIASHPWVKHASVKRRFPAKLEVTIVEHRPVAMMSLGDLYLVNDDGEPFKRVQIGENIDVPMITGIDREQFLASREEGVRDVKAAIDVMTAYSQSPAGQGHALSEVHRDDDGYDLFTADEEIHFGLDDVDAKLARLAQVRRALSSRQLSAAVIRLDNRARPNWITVQPTAAHPASAQPASAQTTSAAATARSQTTTAERAEKNARTHR